MIHDVMKCRTYLWVLWNFPDSVQHQRRFTMDGMDVFPGRHHGRGIQCPAATRAWVVFNRVASHENWPTSSFEHHLWGKKRNSLNHLPISNRSKATRKQWIFWRIYGNNTWSRGVPKTKKNIFTFGSFCWVPWPATGGLNSLPGH